MSSWLCFSDARDTDILGEPGRGGRKLAGRGAFETTWHVRRKYRAGQGPDRAPEETARLPGLPGVRHALRQRRTARSDHRAHD